MDLNHFLGISISKLSLKLNCSFEEAIVLMKANAGKDQLGAEISSSKKFFSRSMTKHLDFEVVIGIIAILLPLILWALRKRLRNDNHHRRV